VTCKEQMFCVNRTKHHIRSSRWSY